MRFISNKERTGYVIASIAASAMVALGCNSNLNVNPSIAAEKPVHPLVAPALVPIYSYETQGLELTFTDPETDKDTSTLMQPNWQVAGVSGDNVVYGAQLPRDSVLGQLSAVESAYDGPGIEPPPLTIAFAPQPLGVKLVWENDQGRVIESFMMPNWQMTQEGQYAATLPLSSALGVLKRYELVTP